MLHAWPQQGLATLKRPTNYQQSNKHVLTCTLFLLIVPLFFANRVQFFLCLIVWVGTVSGCHLSTFIICHRSLHCTVVQSATKEGVQKLSKQSHTGIHRACLCLCLTHIGTSKLIINIICYSKDLPSHFHQLYDIGREESALVFQDIKQMAHVL